MSAFKCLMVDVDGVIVRRPDGKRWDHALEADLGINADALQREFFRPHFNDIVLGRAALEDRLAPVLAQIAPHASAERLMAYWFAADAHLDEGLLADLAAIRASGTPLHLATVQEHRRAAYLWNDLALKERFDAMHYAAAYGAAKPDPAFYNAVASRTGFAPGDLLLLDDSRTNVIAARDAGWQARLWSGEQTLSAVLAVPQTD